MKPTTDPRRQFADASRVCRSLKRRLQVVARHDPVGIAYHLLMSDSGSEVKSRAEALLEARKVSINV